MADKSNKDILEKTILPIIFENVLEEYSPKNLFLLEMKVNSHNVDPDSLDSTKIELTNVYTNFDKLGFDIAFNMFEYKENKEFVKAQFDE